MKPEELADLQAFWDKLYRHDWTHEMSDSYEVTLRGRDADAKLRTEIGKNEAKRALYEAWKKYAWSFQPNKLPQPERPTDTEPK